MQEYSLNKVDHVVGEIERNITSGVWEIGSQIPTEAELAKLYECSRVTVSKAMARLTQSGLVERRTRAGTRVLRNSVERGTTPLNLDACAFIYPTDQHESIWRAVSGFQGEARRAGRRTLMLSTNGDFRQEAEIIGRLAEFDVKGAVIHPVILTPQDRIYYEQVILACRFPVVLIDVNLPGLGRPAAILDGFHAGYTLTRYLLEKGVRKIGFIANYAWVQVVRDRYMGYRRALEEAGVAENREWVLLDPGMHPDYDDPLKEPTEICREYLLAHEDVEGVVCASDFFGRGCLKAASELNRDVPGQLKVVGVDDLHHSPYSKEMSLTAYRTPYEDMGRVAYRMLEAQLGDRGLPPLLEEQLRGAITVGDSA